MSLAVAGGCCCFITVVTIIVLVAVGFTTLAPNEYGIEFNSITQTINSDPNAVASTSGRVWLGVGKTYITFPSTAEEIIFDTAANCASSCSGDVITARTIDGLIISISVTFRFRLTQSLIVKVYQSFGTNFVDYFIPLARSTLQDVASTYNATTFYNDRDMVGLVMDTQLNAVLTPYGAVVDNLQLKGFTLPTSFTDSIALTQQVTQNTQTALNDQKTTVINLATQVAAAQLKYTINQQQAAGNAQAALVNKQAQAVSYLTRFKTEQTSYQALFNSFNSTFNGSFTQDDLISFIKMQIIQETGASANVIDVSIPSNLKQM